MRFLSFLYHGSSGRTISLTQIVKELIPVAGRPGAAAAFAASPGSPVTSSDLAQLEPEEVNYRQLHRGLRRRIDNCRFIRKPRRHDQAQDPAVDPALMAALVPPAAALAQPATLARPATLAHPAAAVEAKHYQTQVLFQHHLTRFALVFPKYIFLIHSDVLLYYLLNLNNLDFLL